MKRCNICGVEKPKSEFYKDSSNSDGLEYRCKICSNQIRRKRVDEITDLLHKHRHKCEKCGETRLYLIDFHHIDPSDKSFTIGDGKHSKNKVLDEIKKCVCLCKNCHWEFHYLYGKCPKNPSEDLYEYLKK